MKKIHYFELCYTIFKTMVYLCAHNRFIMEEKKKTRGGKRTGAGRPRSATSKLYAFRAKEELVPIIDHQKNKSDFICSCIEKCVQQAPDLSRIGKVFTIDSSEEVEIPFFDIKVVAGFPIPLDNDEIAQKIQLIKMLCPHPEASYLIKVQGDSMVDSNIFSDDILVIDKSNRNPTENEVAMCELNGEYTIKFVRKENGRHYLVPANPNYPHIEIKSEDEFRVWGVVTFVIHRPNSV